MIKFFVVTALAVVLAGCHTTGSLQAGAGGSTFEVRDKTYKQVWNASVEAVSSQLTIVDSNRTVGDIRAEKGMGMATWGEVIGVFIRPTTPVAEVYIVEVQSLKRAALQLTGQNWERTMVEGIKARLDM